MYGTLPRKTFILPYAPIVLALALTEVAALLVYLRIKHREVLLSYLHVHIFMLTFSIESLDHLEAYPVITSLLALLWLRLCQFLLLHILELVMLGFGLCLHQLLVREDLPLYILELLEVHVDLGLH